jgi:hypothetical protein
MKLIVLVPKVVRNFVAQFPEVRHNAYKYFNYDRRVVDERVERYDEKPPYKYADDFTDSDYNELVTYAKTLVNPILAKYNTRVACEDALHMAIRSYNQGLFDGKVNAGRYAVLLDAMRKPDAMLIPIMAKEKEQKSVPQKPKEKTVTIKAPVLKDIGMERKDIPTETSLSPAKKKLLEQTGLKRIVKEKGKVVKK